MRIIGKDNNNCLICVASHEELVKYFGRTGYCFEVGGSIDLGCGYDYNRDIVKACESLKKVYSDFGSVQRSMIAFAEMVVKSNISDKE